METMLDFVLDLRTLSPPLLRDLKQSLLQLGNYYAVSSKPRLDRIGLCYVFRDRVSGSDEMTIAYNPHGNFNLRDFHHAMNNLPSDAFSPECKDVQAVFQMLADHISDKIMHAPGVLRDKDVARKVVLIFSCLVDALDLSTVKALMDVADKCIFVEFLLLEQSSNHPGDITVSNNFVEQIRSLKNCSFRTYVPDRKVLLALAKRWFQELKDDMKKPTQARFIFKNNLNNTGNQIYGNLFPSYNSIVDEFNVCQTCRCHGIPLEEKSNNQTKRSLSCPVTKEVLGESDIIDNSIMVGEHTILNMPSFRATQKPSQVSSIIDFNVIQRTNLGSLSEGLVMGAAYFVTPTRHDSDDNIDKSERDGQFFQVVCSILNGLDEGLVCSSNCNIETLMETSIQCYYILLPSDKGLMLLRRLSAAEEFLPIPDVRQFNSPLAEEVENTLQWLQKIELRDYNPLQNERGFHQKLNLLVKESLHFGAILPKAKVVISESELPTQNPSLEVQPSEQAVDIIVAGEKTSAFDFAVAEDNTKPSNNTEEWEQLIVTEFGGTPHSPTSASKSKPDKPVSSLSSQINKQQLDEKTSRILERLEGPRQLKRKSISPTISRTISDASAPAKKPLIPYEPTTHAAERGPIISSQPIKHNFQRIKKKR